MFEVGGGIGIISTIGYVALGFVPTLAALELVWKKAYRLGRSDAATTTAIADTRKNTATTIR